MLKLGLVQIPAYPSAYGPLPERMRFLRPDAAAALVRIETATAQSPRALPFVLSDVFRSPAASLVALKRKRGVQPPGYSAHNFGLAFDAATETLGAAEYRALVDLCRTHGFECFRRGYTRGREEWHFTYAAPGSGAPAVERVIQQFYGKQLLAFAGDVTEHQRALASLDLYHGKIDGQVGPLTRAGLAAFVQQWGTADSVPRTLRVLAVVTAERTGQETPVA